MSSKGLHWYNNGTVEMFSKECPIGFKIGRLPKSAETIEKIKTYLANRSEEEKKISNEKRSSSLKSVFASMSDEKKDAMYRHRRETNQLKSDAEKRTISAKISANTIGKNKGKIPWNKNVPMSDEQRKKVSEGMKSFMKTVSNEYLTSWRKQVSVAMKSNGTYGKSADEEKFYQELVSQYGLENVKRQYSDERYSFDCDFYISSEDLFIELNKHWTHGGHPFDKNDFEDIQKLSKWQEKAQTSKFYRNAIYVWTDLDVRKKEIAKKNNLNYKVIY